MPVAGRQPVAVMSLAVAVWLPLAAFAAPLTLTASSGSMAQAPLGKILQGAFVLEGTIDPALEPGGDPQTVAAIVIAAPRLPADSGKPSEHQAVCLALSEGAGRGHWTISIDGHNETGREPTPKPPGWYARSGYQQPNWFSQRDGGYRLRIVGLPRRDGMLLRFFIGPVDRPVAEYEIDRRLTDAQCWLQLQQSGDSGRAGRASFNVTLRSAAAPDAEALPTAAELILAALDETRPEVRPAIAAFREGRPEQAVSLLLQHMRSRRHPAGPSWDEVTQQVLHPDYREIAEANLAGRYGNLGWFSQFAADWTDANGKTHARVLPDGSINWARENGFLNRHFHWVALAKAFDDTADDRYASHFSREVLDWVSREPFFWENCPQVGGVNLMDGTVFRTGFMNTSNIGRRCELTWWPAYEVFRKVPAFTDEAHLAMLLGFLRQSRLLMNPTSFAAHDDGGAHGALALLQNGLMLPEFRESAAWQAEAVRRWDELLPVQFYPDGGHVSGSTGYNWASIHALENLIRLLRRTGTKVPPRYLDTLRQALLQPIALSRPDQGQIDLNDGGWGLVDDHYRVVCNEFFPADEVFRWMASRGKTGRPPAFTSIALPNSGHLVQRTGWGPAHQYLFMDAGPFGASHGKNDKLTIYLALGPHQLLASGGRGSYDANPFSRYTGSTYAHNTLLVDGLPQQRIGLPETHTGHVPEARRWQTSAKVDYAEGFYRSGWHGPARVVGGVQTRQLICLKGGNPPATAFWVVIDTVVPDDDLTHDYTAVFHSRRDRAELDDPSLAFTCVDHSAGFRVLPADPNGLSLRDAIGQTEPVIQGWHVVGRQRAAMHTAEYRWTATGSTRRIWLLETTLPPASWQIADWQLIAEPEGFDLRLTRADGTSERITSRGAAGHDRLMITCGEASPVIVEPPQ